MQEIETHGRESKRKPSVEMNMHGGAKNRNWLFTGRVSELTYPQNTLLLFGKCYFWNRQLTVGAPLNCGAAELRTCGSVELWICGPAYLRTCGSVDLRSCGAVRAKNSKYYKVSKLKFWHLGFVRCHSKAMFGYLPLNFSIISVIFVASGRLNA